MLTFQTSDLVSFNRSNGLMRTSTLDINEENASFRSEPDVARYHFPDSNPFPCKSRGRGNPPTHAKADGMGKRVSNELYFFSRWNTDSKLFPVPSETHVHTHCHSVSSMPPSIIPHVVTRVVRKMQPR